MMKTNPFGDKGVEENKSHEKSCPKLARRRDFIVSDNEEIQESILAQTEDKNESENLNLLKESSSICEGNPVSTIDEEGFMEKNHEEEFEANHIFGKKVENFNEFLPIDISLHSRESVIVSQNGNPFDELPFEHLVTDNSNDSNQRKDKIVKSAIECKRQITSRDDVMAEAVADSRQNKKHTCEATSKGDRLNPSSLLESDEYEISSEEATVSLRGGKQTGPFRENYTGHSGVASKLSSLKNSYKKTFPCDKYVKILPSKRSYENHKLSHKRQKRSKGALVVLPGNSQSGQSRKDYIIASRKPFLKHSHKRQKQSEGAAVSLPGDNQTGPFRENHTGHSGIVSKESSLKRPTKKTFPCDKCENIRYSKKSDKRHKLHHKRQKTSKGALPVLPRDSQSGQSRKDYIIAPRKPSLKHSHKRQKQSEGASVALPGDNQTGPPREDPNEHPGVVSKKSS